MHLCLSCKISSCRRIKPKRENIIQLLAMPLKPRTAVKARAAPSKKTRAAPKKKAAASLSVPAPSASTASGSKTVRIVSSKVCQAFATRATALSSAIAAAHPGAVIEVDTQAALGRKPDVGSFVVTCNGVDIVRLERMARPFTAMKSLDMSDVAARVVAALA